MKLKLDDAGHVVVADGKPLYVHDDGKEVAFDAQATVATISRLNGEAKSHREAKEAFEARLKPFEGIEDADAARRALETVKNLESGDLVKAGKVEEIKAAAKRAAEEQVAAANKQFATELDATKKEAATLQGQLYDEKIGGSFSRSKFIAEKIAVPTDLLQAQFGRNFKVQDGKIVAHDAAGNPIYSRARPGEMADFDEAIETIVNGYAHKDMILKGTGSSGSGAKPSNGGGAGAKMVSRSEYEKMPVAQKMSVAADAAKGQVQIVDRPV